MTTTRLGIPNAHPYSVGIGAVAQPVVDISRRGMLRDIAGLAGITECGAHEIVADLVTAGYVRFFRG